MRRSVRQQPLRGFTLIEALVVLAIVGILTTVALPNYQRWVQRQQLRQAGEALLQDLRHARELAVNARSEVHVRFLRSGPHAWCWGLSRTQPCDCSATGLVSSTGNGNGNGALPACNISRNLSQDYPDVELGQADALMFEPRLGQAPSFGQVSFATAQGLHLQVRLSALGRARLCGPETSGAAAC